MSTIENLDKTNLMKSMGNYDETLYLRSLARFLALSFYFRFFFFSIVRDASHVYWQQGQHEPLTHTHRHHCLQNWLQRFFVRYNIQDNTIPLAIATYFVQFVSTTSFCRTFERDTNDRKKERSSTKCSHLGPVQSCIFSSLSGDQIKTNWLHLLNIRRNWNRLLQYLTRSSVASAFLLHSRLFFYQFLQSFFIDFRG